jgi:hypothetical protein
MAKTFVRIKAAVVIAQAVHADPAEADAAPAVAAVKAIDVVSTAWADRTAQSTSVSEPLATPSLQVAAGGGADAGGGGDTGGGAFGGDAAHAPAIAPCLKKAPFLLFLTASVCPFKQTVTFFDFLFLAALSPAPVWPSAVAVNIPRMVRRGVLAAQRRTIASNWPVSTPRLHALLNVGVQRKTREDDAHP